ncbi:response regulator [Glycomyces sp. NRRL B-16210]|uniref:response regulator n=1 Tax=Glycomyces sp. NRRL B-16210 TaxID=1463821 RepID=UPI0004BE99E3|nr:response regulator [Glycomyces sp. NRRL B-16210]
MSEAMWIELIRALPTFLWIGFGFIALAIARRLLTAQAPRMTRVETPWVTVELAQQAIAAAGRGAAHRAAPPIETEWSAPYPALPSQRTPVGAPQQPRTGAFTAPPDAARPDSARPDHAHSDSRPDQTDGFGAAPSTADEAPPSEPLHLWLPSGENEFHTDPASQATPPADEPLDSTVAIKKSDDKPPSPVTEPNRQVPGVPPTYPVIPTQSRPAFYPSPGHAPQHSYAASAPLPPYPPQSVYQPVDTQHGLRAATRLAMSADLLQGGAILWVDDHQEWNEPLIRLFRTAGIGVDAVASTARAILALKERHYDLVITDMRRLNESGGDSAGINLLDQMIAVGVPTPAIIFSDNVTAKSRSHPRAVTVTSNPEQLVDAVVDIVGTRRGRTHQSGWLDRLRGGH